MGTARVPEQSGNLSWNKMWWEFALMVKFIASQPIDRSARNRRIVACTHCGHLLALIFRTDSGHFPPVRLLPSEMVLDRGRAQTRAQLNSTMFCFRELEEISCACSRSLRNVRNPA